MGVTLGVRPNLLVSLASLRRKPQKSGSATSSCISLAVCCGLRFTGGFLLHWKILLGPSSGYAPRSGGSSAAHRFSLPQWNSVPSVRPGASPQAYWAHGLTWTRSTPTGAVALVVALAPSVGDHTSPS